jgi:hypothetical protein
MCPCILNSKLDLEKRALRTVTGGHAYVNGFVFLAEGLDMFRLGTITTSGKINPSGNLSFMNRTLVEWMSVN